MRVLLLIIGFFLTGNAARNDLTKQNLKGRVKTLTYCQYPVSLGRVDTGWSTIYVFRYDERGNQVEDDDYTGGSLQTGFGKLNHKHIYLYDGYGNQIEVDEYKADGTLNQKVLYTYDKDGNRTERRNYSPDGRLWRRSVFRYNDRGEQIGCDKYNADSVLLEQFTYKYDPKGNMAAELFYVYRLNDSMRYRTWYYNVDSSQNDKVVRLDYMKFYTYDDSGKKMTEVNNIYGSTYPFTTNFRYEGRDAEGNWLREIYIENDKPTSIIDRVIEYY